MNKFLLTASLGSAFQVAMAAPAAQPPDRPQLTVVPREAAGIVVLPTALRRQRPVGRTWAMGEGRRLRLGLMTGRAAFSDLLPLGASAPGRVLAGAEFDQKLDWGYANIKIGTIRQMNSLLGKPKSEASPWNVANRTAFTSLSLGYTLSPSTSLVGMASFGRTSGVQDASLLADSRPAVAAALSIGLSTRKLFNQRDSAGLALIAPTKRVGFTNVDGTPGAPRGIALGARYGIDF
jgi:hypothetical protein